MGSSDDLLRGIERARAGNILGPDVNDIQSPSTGRQMTVMEATALLQDMTSEGVPFARVDQMVNSLRSRLEPGELQTLQSALHRLQGVHNDAQVDGDEIRSAPVPLPRGADAGSRAMYAQYTETRAQLHALINQSGDHALNQSAGDLIHSLDRLWQRAEAAQPQTPEMVMRTLSDPGWNGAADAPREDHSVVLAMAQTLIQRHPEVPGVVVE